MIGKAVFARLSQDTDVAAAVGTRIFPELSPKQQEFPVIVYDVANVGDTQAYDGPGDLKSYHVTIICVARTYAGAVDLASKVRASIDNQSGDWTDDINVEIAFVEDETEDVMSIADAGDVRFHLKSLECLIWARPTA